MPFLRETFGKEPESNFRKREMLITPGGQALDRGGSYGSFNSLPESLRRFSDGASLRKFFFSVRTEKPSDEHDIYDMEFNSKEGRLSCFLWQRSYFYNRAKFATHGWHLRWFSFTKDQIRSVPDRSNYKKRGMKYPKFKQFEFDDKRNIIRLPNTESSRRKECELASWSQILCLS
jgi:hypothetical protein